MAGDYNSNNVVDAGDYVADVSKIGSTLGWRATVGLQEGLARTVAFYRETREHYW